MPTSNIAIKYCEFLDKKGKTFNVAAGVACIALLGTIDYYSDIYFMADYSLALFYLLPVSFVAWFSGRDAAIAIAIACAATKTSIQISSTEALSLLIWKNGSAFAFLLILGILLAKMRQLLDHERLLSRIDPLTGSVNRRAFLEAMTNEVFRLSRYGHPLSIVYIDLDNFKKINDIHGHNTGDFVLQTVVSTISHNLRRTDVVARLGGDEFAILLPDTDKKASLVTTHKILEQLNISMKRHDLAITFSIGLLTCTVAPKTVDEIITIADNLMYEAKKSGKNGIRHEVYASCDVPVPV